MNKLVNIPFSVQEAKKSNILVTGINQQGKSRLAMAIADTLQNQGISDNWQVIIFDNVGIWKNRSSIPHYLEVNENSLRYVLPKEESIIYDISRLLPVFQKEFVENVLADLWTKKLDGEMPRWTLIIFEEAHLYMRNTRSLVSQNIMRVFSVGANHKIRTLAISPSLTGIETEFIRLTGQRYHFRLGLELNAKRRFKGYYGKDWELIAENLDVGFCIYYLNGELQVHGIPLFETEYLPEPVKIKPIIRETLKPKKKGLLRIFTGLTKPNRFVRDVTPQEDLDNELEEEEDFILVAEDW